MRIVLTGGGTLGSVMPLLAIANKIKNKNLGQKTEFLFIGTKNGIEKEMVEKENINFKSICTGKLRRYFSFENFIDPIFIFLGFIQCLFVLKKFRPGLIIGAGGFVSLPVIIAGYFLKIPSLTHQQDLKPSLTNKILTPFISKVTVTFEKSLKDFSEKKAILTGNIVREKIFQGNRERAKKKFHLEENLPCLLVIGGGTGALTLNKIIAQSLPKLQEFSQVLHQTGKNKKVVGLEGKRYYGYEFLYEIEDAYAISDLVISRAGMSVLSELAALKKPVILIPLPNTHQEGNTFYLEKNEACVYLKQENLTSKILIEEVKKLLENKEKLKKIGENLNRVLKTGDEIIEEIKSFV